MAVLFLLSGGDLAKDSPFLVLGGQQKCSGVVARATKMYRWWPGQQKCTTSGQGNRNVPLVARATEMYHWWPGQQKCTIGGQGNRNVQLVARAAEVYHWWPGQQKCTGVVAKQQECIAPVDRATEVHCCSDQGNNKCTTAAEGRRPVS